MVNILLDPFLILPLLVSPDAFLQTQMARASVMGTRTQIRIERHIIVRVPAVTMTRSAMPAAAAPVPPISWVERKGEQCVPVGSLAAASISRPDSVDLLLAGGRRMRARLGDDCPSLGFYSGFYLRPPPDGQVCAGRDSIRSRSGGECRIEKFRALQPAQ